jgi:hypothetical protein
MSSTQVTESARGQTLSIRVVKALLSVSVAKFGKMSPRVEVRYGAQRWKTSVSYEDTHPRWHEGFTFEPSEIHPLELRVVHKALILGDVEVGTCRIEPEEIADGKTIAWWPLHATQGRVGSVLLCFALEDDKKYEAVGTSELKEEYLKKLDQLELEREELEYYKRKYKQKAEKCNREKRIYRQKMEEIMERVTPIVTEQSSDSDTETEEAQKEFSRLDMVRAERNKIREEINSIKKEKQELMKLRIFIGHDIDKLRTERHRIAQETRQSHLTFCRCVRETRSADPEASEDDKNFKAITPEEAKRQLRAIIPRNLSGFTSPANNTKQVNKSLSYSSGFSLFILITLYMHIRTLLRSLPTVSRLSYSLPLFRFHTKMEGKADLTQQPELDGHQTNEEQKLSKK